MAGSDCALPVCAAGAEPMAAASASANISFFGIFVDCSIKAATCHDSARPSAIVLLIPTLEGRSMALDAELLEILACPNCKTPVVLFHNGAGLKCNTCHRVYPIKDDIPVMLIDE